MGLRHGQTDGVDMIMQSARAGREAVLRSWRNYGPGPIQGQGMPEHDCVEVVITADDAEWLAGFTRQLVEDRLVACGHNISSIRAVYRWEGKVHDDPQARVGLHTRASLVPAIVERADRDHPDDVPCVIALPITDGHPEYLKWVYEETHEPPEGL